eukprot:TRINITY_DN47601_c0_g1_i1.p1 TRINITY_DN47601_c0_g1~~TRINITY_DN47601_c0_g1_i1.p1  ORF type:complete len:209 (+),score=94.11 TRINITY_DN47601_c0_g1_i1:60-629(+)
MTTAHRPTFNSAIADGIVGGSNRNAFNKGFVSARDLPGNLHLKRRQDLAGKKPAPPRDEPKETPAAPAARVKQRDADIDLASSDDSEEEDDEAELLRELEKIKRERAEEAAKKKAEEAREEEEQQERDILEGNPLMSEGASAMGVKRRWDDDVVFRNQARDPDAGAKRRFVNDTIRSDFHRKFISRYFK